MAVTGTTNSGIEGIGSLQSNYEKYKERFTEDKHDLITMSNFYQLLVAEMSNQDPLEPTSNTEFISQMASFTALQAQQDAFKTQQQDYANSLVGQTVTVSIGDGKVETGVVSYVNYSGDDPKVSVNGKSYNLSAISQVHGNATQTSAIGDYGAFAAGILGKTAVVQSMDSTGATFVDEGVVDSIEIKDGKVNVVVNGYAYSATDVLRVRETEIPTYNYTAQEVSDAVKQDAASTAAAAPVQQVNAAVHTEDDDIADIEAIDENESDIYKLFE